METMTQDEITEAIEQNEAQMGEAIRDLKAAKKARAEAIADGADPDTTSEEVRQITERLEGLTSAAEVLQRRYEEAQQRQEREKAKQDLALVVEEAEQLADGYEDAVEEAQAAADRYIEKASVALSARGESERLRQTARVLCDLHGLEMPEMPRINATDKRREEILNAHHRIERGDLYRSAVRNMRLDTTRLQKSKNGTGEAAEERLRREVVKVVDDLMGRSR